MNNIPKKIVLLGHSYGSAISNAVISANPGIVDAAILTGWGFNSGEANIYGVSLASMQPRIANLQNPTKWGVYDSGYLAIIDKFAAIDMYATPFMRT